MADLFICVDDAASALRTISRWKAIQRRKRIEEASTLRRLWLRWKWRRAPIATPEEAEDYDALCGA